MRATRRADRRERAHVGHDDGEAVLAVHGHEGIADNRETILASADQDHPGPEPGEGVRRRPAQAGRGTRDQDGPTSEHTGRWRHPSEQASPYGDADPAEARHERQLKAVVDERPDVHQYLSDRIGGPAIAWSGWSASSTEYHPDRSRP